MKVWYVINIDGYHDPQYVIALLRWIQKRFWGWPSQESTLEYESTNSWLKWSSDMVSEISHTRWYTTI